MDYNKLVALQLTLKHENDIICTENQSFIIRIDAIDKTQRSLPKRFIYSFLCSIKECTYRLSVTVEFL